jgi:hypothetical protein
MAVAVATAQDPRPRPGWYVGVLGTAGFAPKCTRYAHPAPKATRRRLAPTSRATLRSAIPLALGLGRSALSLSSSMPVLGPSPRWQQRSGYLYLQAASSPGHRPPKNKTKPPSPRRAHTPRALLWFSGGIWGWSRALLGWHRSLRGSGRHRGCRRS